MAVDLACKSTVDPSTANRQPANPPTTNPLTADPNHSLLFKFLGRVEVASLKFAIILACALTSSLVATAKALPCSLGFLDPVMIQCRP